MQHPLQCRCGTVKGWVDPRGANRAMCYCKDCQAFAHFLGRDADILDELGGSQVIQAPQKNVMFTHGADALACMRLTEKGMLRWYAGCCKTPIGNTMANYKISFVGLVHTCLESANHPLENSFGPIRVWVNTKSALKNPKPKPKGLGAAILWFAATTVKARLDGSYRQSPFFVAGGAPIATPRVLGSL
jgi:hypothetical protein